MKENKNENIDILEKIHVDKISWQPVKKRNPILDQVSIDLNSGRFYGLLGPNGAGKTSFVRQLLKLQTPTCGTIEFDDEDMKNINRRNIATKLAFLPQNINGNVEFTVEEIVTMGREPYRKALAPLTSQDKEIIHEAMELADCLKFKDKSIRLLSGGERQRVMIARTIAQDTPWIILDEPVSNLDIPHQVKLMQLLNRLRIEKRKTIVAILHDINLAATFCSHIILMKDGNVVVNGGVQEVLTADNLERLYGMEFEILDVKGKTVPYIFPKYGEKLMTTGDFG